MNNIDKQDFEDENEFEIVDLGAPRAGFSSFLFSLGKKMSFVAYRRTRLALFMFLTCTLLVLLFQPYFSFPHNSTANTHRIPTATTLHQHVVCQMVDITDTSVQKWSTIYVSATPSTSMGTYMCFYIIPPPNSASTPVNTDKTP